MTPLIADASGDNDKTVRLLIEQGADVNLQAKRGPFVSVLVAAVTLGTVDTVKLVLCGPEFAIGKRLRQHTRRSGE